jgi:hypothetical protein
MFVSTAGGGKIYNFDLSKDRKELVLKDALADKIVDSNVEEDSITFAEGFTMITDLEMNPYDGNLYVVAPVDGDSAAGSVYKIVSTSPPEPIQDPASPNIIQDPVSPNNIIQDPVSPENTIKFPSGIESKQGDQPKKIEDKDTINNNSDLSTCNKLKSFDKGLSDTWIERKITDEQVMYLGQQVKELMIEAGCIK